MMTYSDETFVKIVAALRNGESVDDRHFGRATRDRLNTLFLAGVVTRGQGALDRSFLYRWVVTGQ